MKTKYNITLLLICILMCSTTTTLAAINYNNFLTDSDNDGVDNAIDQCPNTALGETVDANGCSSSQLAGVVTFSDVYFTNLEKAENNGYILSTRPESYDPTNFGRVTRLDNSYNPSGLSHKIPNYGSSPNTTYCIPLNIPGNTIALRIMDLDGNNFIATSNTCRTYQEERIIALLKYNNQQTDYVARKEIFASDYVDFKRIGNINYALIGLDRVNGITYDGSFDYSFTYDNNIPGIQTVLMAFDDNLNELWHVKFDNPNLQAGSGFFYGTVPVSLTKLSNNNLLIQLNSVSEVLINGQSYGAYDGLSNSFYFQFDPVTQTVIGNVYTAPNTVLPMYEDPYNPLTFYISYTENTNSQAPPYLITTLEKLDSNFNVLESITSNDVLGHLQSARPHQIYFTSDDLILCNRPTTVSGYTDKTRFYYFDRDLEFKYKTGYEHNVLGYDSNDDSKSNHKFLEYKNNKVVNVQSYSDVVLNTSFQPKVNNINLPLNNGGINTLIYGEDLPFLQSSKTMIVATGDAIDVKNYQKPDGQGNYTSTESHISYLIFPDNHDFNQYETFDFYGDTNYDEIPLTWLQIPFNWTLSYVPVFEIDNNNGLKFFQVYCHKTGSGPPASATETTRLKVYMVKSSFLNVEDFQNNQVQIYPNPTTDFINIKTNDPITTAELYNLHGQKVNASFSNNTVDVQNIASGIYFLKLKTSKGEISKKIIKN